MDTSSETSMSEEQLLLSSNNSMSPLLHRLAVLKVRHLQKIVGCNITPPPGYLPPHAPSCLPAALPLQPLQSGYFLSLHASASLDCPAFLTTELQCSSCPLWARLNIATMVPNTLHTAKGFVARVWYKPPAALHQPVVHLADCASSSLCQNNGCSRMHTNIPSHCPDDNITDTLHFDSNANTSVVQHSNYFDRGGSSDPIPCNDDSTYCQQQPYFKSVPEPLHGTVNTTPPVLVFSWGLCLSGLVPVGTNLTLVAPSLANNSLVFQLIRGSTLYTAASCIIASPAPWGDEEAQSRCLWYGVSLPMSQTKRSYTPATVTKLHQTERDISVLVRRCAELGERLRRMSVAAAATEREQRLHDRVSAAQARVRVCRTVVQRERDALAAVQKCVHDTEALNQEKGLQLLTLLQLLSRERQQLRGCVTHTEQQLQHLHRTRALLAHRRGRLVRDLAYVYPIVQISPKDDFSISNIWIPDAQYYNESNLQTPSFLSGMHRSKPGRISSSNKVAPATNKSNLTGSSENVARDELLGGEQVTSADLDFSLQQQNSSVGTQISPKTITTSSNPQLRAYESNNKKNHMNNTLSPTHLHRSSLSIPTHLSSSSILASSYTPFHPNSHLSVPPSALPHTTESLSAALGMTSHLLCLTAGLLQLPLRYPVSPAGSLATVTDVASVQLPQHNMRFPLYSRGKERERPHFNYGVFLLNKNIGQLLHYLGHNRSKLPAPSAASLSPSATLHSLHTVLTILTRYDRPLHEVLPDLRCQPLLTCSSQLRSDLLLPPCIPPSGPEHLFLDDQLLSNEASTLQSKAIGVDFGNGAAYRVSDHPHSPQHSRSCSQSLSHTPQHSLSKSPSPSRCRSHRLDQQASKGGDGGEPPPPGITLSRSLDDFITILDSKNVEAAGSGSHAAKRSSETRRGSRVESGASRGGRSTERSPRPNETGLSRTEATIRETVVARSLATYSLDKGLDHINSYVCDSSLREFLMGKSAGIPDFRDIKNRGSFTSSQINSNFKTTTGSLTNLTKDRSLVVVSDSIDFEETRLSSFEDQTTSLLRSWHDDAASVDGNFKICGSSDQLEEVGVEATENFMTVASHESVRIDRGSTSDVPSDDSSGPCMDQHQLAMSSSPGSDVGVRGLSVTRDDPAASSETSPADGRGSSKSLDGKKTKVKNKGFWPFSRSNTSEENSRENTITGSELLLSLGSSSRPSSLENDEVPGRSEQAIEATPNKSIAGGFGKGGEENLQPDEGDTKEQGVAVASLKATTCEGEVPSDVAAPPSSDDLLQESIAAMSEELIGCADFSKLSDLTEVADRTAKLASKTFSFKMGSK